jgi:hypothetical protein
MISFPSIKLSSGVPSLWSSIIYWNTMSFQDRITPCMYTALLLSTRWQLSHQNKYVGQRHVHYLTPLGIWAFALILISWIKMIKISNPANFKISFDSLKHVLFPIFIIDFILQAEKSLVICMSVSKESQNMLHRWTLWFQIPSDKWIKYDVNDGRLKNTKEHGRD